MPAVREPISRRVQTIEGRRVAVVERRPPLQPTLEGLLGALRVSYRAEVWPSGARPECETLREHRLVLFRKGRHVGTDGVIRDLRLDMCRDCGATSVRDVSVDLMGDVTVGGRGPRRRDLIIGWYSGARRAGREYR